MKKGEMFVLQNTVFNDIVSGTGFLRRRGEYRRRERAIVRIGTIVGVIDDQGRFGPDQRPAWLHCRGS